MPRFALLEHTGAPDDPAGRHFDLLVEAGAACRTWRLAELPRAGGAAVAAVALPPHRLAWLDHESGEVSGGRGFARRVDGGTCEEPAGAADRADASRCDFAMSGAMLRGRLVLKAVGNAWEAMLTGQ